MRIRKLSLKNFRQFYGEQTILFADGEDKNVTVIHGENGSGKTALLNAFKWGFFEEVDFDTGKNDLLSERSRIEAQIGDDLEMYVEIQFEHNGLTYDAHRSAHFQVGDQANYRPVGRCKLKLSFMDAQGEYRESQNPKTHIDQLFPQRLHSYFFFNGERIEKLANHNASAEIKDAVEGLMGLESIERARRHVSEHAVKKFQKALAESSSGDLAESIQKEEKLTGRLEIVTEKLITFKKNLREYQEESIKIDHRLRDIEEVAGLQNRRMENTEQRDDSRNQLQELKDEKAQYISQFGFLAFSGPMLSSSHALLADKRAKGELPGKIKAQLIDDLLDNEICICGRSLEDEAVAIEELEKYRLSSVPDDLENAFITMSAATQAMIKKKEEVRTRMQKFVSRADTLRKDIEKYTGRLDDIATQITATGHDQGIENIQTLEDRRSACRQKVEELNHNIGEFSSEEKGLYRDLEETKEARDTIEKKKSAERVADARLKAAEEIEKVLGSLYSSLSDKVKAELSEIVNKSFQDIIRKSGWRVEITDD